MGQGKQSFASASLVMTVKIKARTGADLGRVAPTPCPDSEARTRADGGTHSLFLPAMATRRTYAFIPDRDSDNEPSTEPLLERGTLDDLHSGSLSVRVDGSYSYAYGPPGLSGLAHNRLALACAVFASLGGLTFGYDQVSANPNCWRERRRLSLGR